jgi:tetracycline repressor-like protein
MPLAIAQRNPGDQTALRRTARGELPSDVDTVVLLETLVAPLYFRLLVSKEALDDWPLAEQVERLLKAYAR